MMDRLSRDGSGPRDCAHSLLSLTHGRLQREEPELSLIGRKMGRVTKMEEPERPKA